MAPATAGTESASGVLPSLRRRAPPASQGSSATKTEQLLLVLHELGCAARAWQTPELRPLPLVRTFTENLMAYALGRPVQYYDQPTIRAIVREAEADDYGMSSFILGVVKSDAFQMKRKESPESEDAAGIGQR